MSPQTVTYFDEVLHHLEIKFRKLVGQDNLLYFCTDSASGLTFDLEYKKNNTIRLWKFIGTTSVLKARKKWVYQKDHDSPTLFGMEVTDEGDICFYAEQTVNRNDLKNNTSIPKLIRNYNDIQKFLKL